MIKRLEERGWVFSSLFNGKHVKLTDMCGFAAIPTNYLLISGKTGRSSPPLCSSPQSNPTCAKATTKPSRFKIQHCSARARAGSLHLSLIFQASPPPPPPPTSYEPPRPRKILRRAWAGGRHNNTALAGAEWKVEVSRSEWWSFYSKHTRSHLYRLAMPLLPRASGK